MFSFLRTYKPILKRARGTVSYPDVRRLLQQWLYCRHMVELLQQQNTRLYQAARQRDRLIADETTFGDTTIFHRQDG